MNHSPIYFFAACLAVCCAAFGAPAAEQLGADAPSATELLWPEGAPGALGDEEKDKPTLMIYPANLPGDDATPAIVILPGGGYGGLAMGHEGHDIAKWFNGLGVSAFIVDYRHRGKGYGHPAPMQDAQRAIRTVRARAKEFNIDPTRVGVIGFSAGGHLASTVATHFDAGDASANDPIASASSRPDFAILCYPVIVFDQDATHRGSQRNLLGESPDPALVESLSNEKQVTSETPPTFLFHTAEDKSVPPENSVAFFLALRKHGVPAEMHIFEKGRHGVGLARDMPDLATWPRLCETWLLGRDVLKTTKPDVKQTSAARAHATKGPMPFHAVECPGVYPQHLQGICTDDRNAIFWSFTSKLVKTDADGTLLAQIDVPDHHGDLCFTGGKVYVAVNFGEFNSPDGNADSWVYVYDANDLKLLDKHATPEAIYGAGGIAYRDGRFFVVGGLPTMLQENYVYEYDPDFKFIARHVIPSGQTHLGIQTAAFAHGQFWFGCYGGELLTTGPDFKLRGKHKFDCALGVAGADDDRLLIARGPRTKSNECRGQILIAKPQRDAAPTLLGE